MNSPFKFLDAYTKEDREIFFGREREIDELYRRAFESRIIMVYGESGTGKSSLVLCGLANKFRDTDWLPLMVRRGENIMDSIGAVVKTNAITPLPYELLTTILFKKAIRSLYIDHYKPIYFIFDQFEELFIFGTKEEKHAFVQLIQALSESDIECRFIFIMREEYMANVSEFEKQIQGFLSNRMRIERMPLDNAIQAIKGPCSVFDIDIEQGFPEKLLNRLNPEGSDIELTYLQVFLDKIYNLAAKRNEEEKGILRFSSDLLEETGDVSDLLGSFLEDQVSQMPDQNATIVVLKSFVSIKGTKRQLNIAEVKDNAYTLGKTIGEPVLVEMIQSFVHLRILRDKDSKGRYELRHDALAMKIFEKISLIEKELLEIRQFVENAFYYWQKRNVLLSEADLKYVSPYKSRLYLSSGLTSFIDKSEKALEGHKRRRRNLAIAIPSLAFLILSLFTIWALIERNKSNSNYIKARANYYRITAKEAASTDPVLGLRLAEYAFSLDSTDDSRRTMYDIYRDYNFYKILVKGNNALFNAKFSPDGKTIVFGSVDNTATLIDLNGNKISNFIHKGSKYCDVFRPMDLGTISGVSSATFSPDGKRIVTGTADGNVILWDLRGQQILPPFGGHNKDVCKVTFSPDGTKVLSSSEDSTAILWDTLGNVIHKFNVFKSRFISRMYTAAFSPDGKMIFTGGVQDGPPKETSLLYDIHGNVLQEFTGHTAGVLASTFSPDGKNILTASSDNTAILWDLQGNIKKEFIGHKNMVLSSAFSPDGEKVLTGSMDNTARLWNLDGSLIKTFTGNEKAVFADFSPDGNKIVTGSLDKTLKLWDLQGLNKHLFKINDNFIRTAIFSPDKELILTHGILFNIIVWDKKGNLVWESDKSYSRVGSASFSPDNQKILISTSDRRIVRIYELQSKKEYIIADTTGISIARFLPDGNIIVGFSGGNKMLKYNAQGVRLGEINSFPLNCVFSPDGKYFLGTSAENTGILYDINYNIVSEFKGHNNAIRSWAWSSDGNRILSGSADNTAILWDLKGTPLLVFKGHEGSISKVEFSPDNSTILTVSSQLTGDNSARLWNLMGYEIQRLSGNESTIISAAFTADGKGVVGVHQNGEVNYWDVKTPLSEFQKRNDYEELRVDQKLEYGISSYMDAIKLTNPKQLYQAGIWFMGNDNILNKKSRIENLTRSIALLEKASSYKNSVYILLELYKAYNLKIFLTGTSDKIIKGKETIISRLDSLREIPDIIEAAGYFYNIAKTSADTAIRIDNYSKCVKLMEKIRGNYIFEVARKTEVFNCYNTLAGLHFGKQNYDAVINNSLKGLELIKTSETLYFNLVLAYLFKKQIDEASLIYSGHKNKLVGGRLFGESVLSELKKSDISASEYEKIKRRLEN